MSGLAEIEAAIEKLSSTEQLQLRVWLNERLPDKRPLVEKLLEVAGSAGNLPPDFAQNHDHYIHGLPKRS